MADPDFAALAARAEAATGCKLGEVRPTATGCGWQRPADLFIANADANRRAALLRLLDDWEEGKTTVIAQSDLCDALELRESGFVKMFGNRVMIATDAGLAAARRERDATTKDTPDA